MADPKTGGRPEGEEDAPAFEDDAQHAQPQPHVASPELPPEQQVRFEQVREVTDVKALPPHAAAQGVAAGPYVDLERNARRGRFKLAATTSVALTIVFLELLWLSPGVGITFGVLMAPLMVYLIRVTRTYMENESTFRRGMANTGSIVITILGALLFMFVSFATIFWIICGNTRF